MSDGFDDFEEAWNRWFPPPKRNDESAAKRWRGPLFWSVKSPLSWKTEDGYLGFLELPRSVTFPICCFCNHLIWEWPHFGEEVPENALCGECFREEEEAQRRDDEHKW